MRRTTRLMAVMTAVAVLVTLAGCDLLGNPNEVSFHASKTVADYRTYHPGAWLNARQLPFGNELHWRLFSSRSSTNTGCCPYGFSSSCGQWPEKQILKPLSQQVPDASGVLDKTFAADLTKAGSPVPVYATETQWFYPTPSAAAAAFAAYAAAYDGCVQLDKAVQETEYHSPVTSTVRRTVTGALAGAWLHLVRHPDGSPAHSEYVEDRYSDNHEYAVVHGNVLAIFTLDINSSVVDGTDSDADLVRQIDTELADYDGRPGKAALPVDPQLDLWQPWPASAQLPSTTGWSWRIDNQPQSIGLAAALGNVACTPLPADGPAYDPTLTGHNLKAYEQHQNAHNGYGFPDSVAHVDLFFFTSHQAAATGNTKLLADLRSCQSRLRAEQTAVKMAPDTVATELPGTAGIAVWTVTGTGLYSSFPGNIDRNSRARSHQHLVLLILRGPLLESIDVDIGPVNASAFTPTADLDIATTAAANLCRYDIGC